MYRCNLFAHPCLYYYLLSTQYTVLHILFYSTFYSVFFTYIYIYSLVLCYIFCTVHWADLTYISLLIIFCIIEYVTNKQTLNLEPVRLVPMCLCQCVWAPPLEDKRPPWESTKAVSCICHPGRSTLGESTKLSLAYVTVTSRGAAHWGIHTLYWRSHHFPLPSPLRIHWKIHAM